MVEKQVRAIVRWPDGVEEKTEWVRDGGAGPGLDALREAIREVLDRRKMPGGAMITWERREVESSHAG